MDVVSRRQRRIQRAIFLGLTETKRQGEPWQAPKDICEFLFERDAIVLEQTEVAELMVALVEGGLVQKQMLGEIPMYQRL